MTLLLFIGFLIPTFFGIPDAWIFICVVVMGLSVIGMIVIMILITKNMSKVGKMDAITRKVREADLLKKKKEEESKGE